jgi:23S rRNA (cytosine1962-C5)-methyltransferase
MSMAELTLKNGRERSLIRRHPWIFSGAIARVVGDPKLGETVDVVSSSREFLAKAAYSPNSNIIGRIWTWEENEQVDPMMLEGRILKAIDSRQKTSDLFHTDAMRLVHGESDGLPGLILDKYGDTFVVQFLSTGAEYWKEEIIDIIKNNTTAKILYERSDMDVRELEGLPLVSGLIFGQLEENSVSITENGVKYQIDIINGHKTGFYLDQRDNRFLAKIMAHDLEVLDCFSYTGGFAINTLLGNAKSVTLVDSSKMALNTAHENIRINNLDMDMVTFVEQDVFKYLRALRDSGKSFDLVILDPPKFAPTSSQADRAVRGYKDINILAFKLLRTGGLLMTFSCSGGVSEELFQKVIAGAALDADVDSVILRRLHQAADHPVSLNFPEGAYLKGFVIQKRG